MRELKFRVWIERYKKYMPISLIDFEPISGKIVGVEVVATGGDWAKFYSEEVILEQYTGLKDKNGEEIYEGDIVKYAYTGCNYKVVYRRYDASFVLENDDREEVIHFRYDRQSDYEVAGNIHENPELLEEE